MILQFRELHCLVAAIAQIGAVNGKTGYLLMCIPVLEHIERSIRVLCAPAGGAGVGGGLPTLNALCAVDLPTAVGLHWASS